MINLRVISSLSSYISDSSVRFDKEPDFFIHHYDEPITENGLPLKDMVRLRLHLS